MIAVISGATKGMGKAIAWAFAKEGFDLALGARTFSELENFKNELNKSFPKIKIFISATDFSVKSEVIEFSEKIKKSFKTIDVLVNNVGTYSEGTATIEKEDVIEKILELNFYSAYHLTRVFAVEMKQKQSGHIFNICSVVSKFPRTNAASYSVSKAALYAFNKVLCEEMRNYNVKVTAILPGSVNTASWDGTATEITEKLIQPNDVAACIINAYRMSKNCLVEEIFINPLDPKF